MWAVVMIRVRRVAPVDVGQSASADGETQAGHNFIFLI